MVLAFEPNSLVELSLPPDTNGWEKFAEKNNVPRAIIEHALGDPAIILDSARARENGMSAGFQPVREMCVSDAVMHRARMVGEWIQGVLDFGFPNDAQAPRPSVEYIGHDGVPHLYDGESNFSNAAEIQTRNPGLLDPEKIMKLVSDNAQWQQGSDEVVRRGGFGMGAKVSITTALAEPSDLKKIVQQYLKGDQFGAWNGEKEALQRFVENPLPDPDIPPFMYIQARDPRTNRYWRAYAYKEPMQVNGVELYSCRFVQFELDEAQIPERDRDMVIFSHVAPHELHRQIWADSPHEILELNPHYPSRKNLVRTPEDPRPLATVRTHTSHSCGLHETNPLANLNWQIEEIEWPPDYLHPEDSSFSPICINGLRLAPKDPQLAIRNKPLHTWNIITNRDPAVARLLPRSSDSVTFTGDYRTLIGYAVASWDQPLNWETPLRSLHEISEGYGGRNSLVEGSFELKCLTGLGVEKLRIPARVALSASFANLFPEAGFSFYANEAKLKVTQSATRTQTHPPRLLAFQELLMSAGITNLDLQANSLLAESTRFSSFSIERITPLKLNLDNSLPATVPSLTKGVMELLSDNHLSFPIQGRGYAQLGATSLHFVLDSVPGVGISDLFESPSIQSRLSNLILGCNQLGIKITIASHNVAGSAGITWKQVGADNYLFAGNLSHQSLDEHEQEFEVILDFSDHNLAKAAVQSFDNAITRLNPSLIKHDEVIAARAAAETERINHELGAAREELAAIRTAAFGSLSAHAQRAASQLDLLQRLGGLGHTDRFPGTGRSTQRGLYAPSPDKEDFLFSPRSGPSFHPAESIAQERYSPDYSITIVDPSHPLPPNLPIQTTDSVRQDSDGSFYGVASASDYVFAGADSGGESVWMVFNPREGEYLESNGAFSAIIAFEQDLILGTEDARTLPVPKGWHIVYAQLPEGDSQVKEAISGTRRAPVILKDTISGHTVIQSRQSSGNLVRTMNIIPRGTRLYIAPDPPNNEKYSNDLARLQATKPEYYAKLIEPLVDEQEFSLPIQRFLVFMRSHPELTRDQQKAAIHIFLDRHRQYDDYQPTSLVDCPNSGRGNCSIALMAEFILLRALRIPSRLETSYPFPRGMGNISYPTHGTIEFINSAGNWEHENPSNSRLSLEFSGKIRQELRSGNVPVIHDAPSMKLGNIPQELHSLPPFLQQYFESIPTANGTGLTNSLIDTFGRSCYGGVENTAQFCIEALTSLAEASSDFPTPERFEYLMQKLFASTILPSESQRLGSVLQRQMAEFIAKQQLVFGDSIPPAELINLAQNLFAAHFSYLEGETTRNRVESLIAADTMSLSRILHAARYLAHEDGIAATLRFISNLNASSTEEQYDILALIEAQRSALERQRSALREQRLALAGDLQVLHTESN